MNDETPKAAVLIAAAIFAARALNDWDGKRSPKAVAAAANCMEKAELLVYNSRYRFLGKPGDTFAA